MREAVGSYFLTSIFIVFVLLFAGYMCLSINMNKAYKVKNEIINIIQKNNGLDENSLSQIQDFMARVGYRTSGNCDNMQAGPDARILAFSSSGSSSNSNKPVFCAKELITEYSNDSSDYSSNYTKAQFPKTVYYQIQVFFSVDLPVVRNFFTFGLRGSTKKLFYPVTM